MKTGTLSPIRRALTGTFALILLIVAAGSVQPQTPGFVTALLRSECTDAPSSPPPVGQTVVGPDYVIRTVGKGDPLDIPAAQRMATDEVFESLMTLYCALPRNSGIGCVSDRVQWNILTYDAAGQWSVSAGPASGGDYHYCSGTNGAAKGYITAVLKSECTPTPSTPPPVGQIVAGADYVILTVAEGDPTDFVAARQAVSDAVFESLMPRYGALPHNTALGCLTDRVQWNVVTYDAAGHSPRSVCAASGCDFHDSPFIPGYFAALLRSECTSAPSSPPPVGQTVVGPDYVIQTVGRGDPFDFPAAQQMMPDSLFESLMTQYCALPRNKDVGCVSARVQWEIITYDGVGNMRVSGGPTSGSDYHYCSGTHGAAPGYFTAVLKSECTPTPSTPPPVGETFVGADYVILTVAEGDPTDLFAARQAVSDAVFESLMPRYRALPRKTGIGCVTNQVHWNVVTYDAAGHSPRSVCAASGCDFHDSPFIPGYFTAVLRSACTSAPLSPPPLGQTVVGPDYVIQTVGRGEALDIPAAQQMATDEVFESLMAQYCALPRDKGIGCVSDRVQWNILTYDGAGQWRVSASPRSGPGYHYCSGTNGIPGGEFITLRRGGWTLTQGIFVTSFPSTPGRQYVLECTDVLDRPAWKRINTAAGTGEILLLRDAADVGTSRFYRVRIE